MLQKAIGHRHRIRAAASSSGRRFAALCALPLSMLMSPAQANSQTATPVPIPLFQPAQEFGPTVDTIKPVEARLTSQEETGLRSAVEAMGPFPAYLFSGCHDRAHAAHMLLPQALRSKVMKIWLVAPGRYTAVLPGLIGLKGSGAATEVSWGHHVALAYRDSSGAVRVVDPVLRPGETLTEQQWFDLMKVPRMTLWTLTKGDIYLIEASALNPSTDYANAVWNGRSERYQLAWIPGNIARDSIGVDAVAGATCPELVQRKKDPWGLLTFLEKGQNGVPAGCRPSVAKFEQLRAQWSTRLGIPTSLEPSARMQASNY